MMAEADGEVKREAVEAGAGGLAVETVDCLTGNEDW